MAVVGGTSAISELWLQAIPCGSFSSQRNWTFNPFSKEIRWGDLCLMTCYGVELDRCIPPDQDHPYRDELLLGECDASENQKFWFQETQLRSLHAPDHWHPYNHDHCVEVLSEHGPTVKTGRCRNGDQVWTDLGMEWARRSLHVNTFRVWSFDDAEMHDGNALCVDVWQGNNISSAASVGIPLSPHQTFVSPRAYAMLVLRRSAAAVSVIIVTLLAICICCKRLKRRNLRTLEDCQFLQELSSDTSLLQSEWQAMSEGAAGKR